LTAHTTRRRHHRGHRPDWRQVRDCDRGV